MPQFPSFRKSPLSLYSIALILVLGLTSLVQAQVRQVLILNSASQARLAAVVKTNAEAKAHFAPVIKDAEDALKITPRPLAVIEYEGLLDNNSKRIKTVEHLKDIDYLGALTWAYSADPKPAYRDKMKQITLAWAKVYKPTGNPINENKLEPMFVAYYLIRDSFTGTDKTTMENWMRAIAEKHRTGRSIPLNNWEPKRFKITGLVGWILNDKTNLDYTIARYKNYLEKALFPDGSSADFKERDALSYHVGGMTPILVFALNADQFGLKLDGKNLFAFTSKTKSSVEKSVLFVDPYAWGDKVHAEFTNTKVELDRQRAEAGLPAYQPGAPFDPEKATRMYELAVAFKPSYMDLMRHLTKSNANSYPTWISLMAMSAYNTPVTSIAPHKDKAASGMTAGGQTFDTLGRTQPDAVPVSATPRFTIPVPAIP